MKYKKYFLYLVVITFFSCGNNRMYEKNLTIKNGEWNYRDAADFEFNIDDTSAVYDVYLNLRITADYCCSNLFLQFHQWNSTGNLTKKLVEYTLAEPDGKWLGRGLGDIYDYSILSPELKELSFKKTGKHKLELKQAMRTDILKNIMMIGIKIVKH